MFDIGFWEITVIAVVALLVVGPEELPTLARTAGRWMRKARSFMSEMKDELEHEVDRGKELKERIAEETKISEAHRALNETTHAVSSVQQELKDAMSADALKPVPKAERDRAAEIERVAKTGPAADIEPALSSKAPTERVDKKESPDGATS